MKDINELMSKALKLFPDALIEEEDDGNIVIITNLMRDADGNIVEFEEEEDE